MTEPSLEVREVLIQLSYLASSVLFLLSVLMCKAMNRSFGNVLFGAFGAPTASVKSAEGLAVQEVSAADAAIRLAYAENVIVIPGYGLAVARAQHLIREMADLIDMTSCSAWTKSTASSAGPTWPW